MSVSNNVSLIGRLTADPELKFTNGSGVAVTTFTIAVDRSFTGQDGQKEVDFINIVAWRKLAENVANHLAKGRLVAVAGSIRVSKYQAQEGTNKYKTEVYADEVKYMDKPKDGSQTTNNLTTDNDEWMPVDESTIPF